MKIVFLKGLERGSHPSIRPPGFVSVPVRGPQAVPFTGLLSLSAALERLYQQSVEKQSLSAPPGAFSIQHIIDHPFLTGGQEEGMNKSL
jgi:hypothetical protein